MVEAIISLHYFFWAGKFKNAASIRHYYNQRYLFTVYLLLHELHTMSLAGDTNFAKKLCTHFSRPLQENGNDKGKSEEAISGAGEIKALPHCW